MDIYIIDQLISCLAFAILGIIAGLVYDTVRTLRYLAISDSASSVPPKLKRFVASSLDLVLDLVLMICLAVAAAVLAYCYSYGKLRLFDSVCLASSFLLYRVTLGKLYLETVRPLAFACKRLVIHAIKLALKPFEFLIKVSFSFIQLLFKLTVGRLILKIKSSRQEKHFESVLLRLEQEIRF